jgi:hypothetical protein
MNTNNIKIGSNRSFGIIFFIFFFILSIYPIFKDESVKIWLLVLAIIFLTLGLLNSPILSPLNKIWFKLGIFLGNFVSPIVMGIVFFIIITPTSFIMKALGKDLLNLKKNNNKSYWIKKSPIKSKMKNQF